jgi:hypothetical protein
MTGGHRKPATLLFAPVNLHTAPSLRAAADARCQELADCFRQAPVPLACETLIAGARHGVFLSGFVQQRAFDPSVLLLHFAGPRQVALSFEQPGGGMQSYDEQALGALLGQFPGLEVLCFDGCATGDLLQAVWRAGVPCVLAHPPGGGGDPPHELYQALAQGLSLSAAVAGAAEKGIPVHLFAYDLERDCFVDPSLGRAYDHHVQPGIYLSASIDRPLRPLPVYLPPVAEVKPVLPARPPARRVSVQQATSILLALTLLSLGGWMLWHFGRGTGAEALPACAAPPPEGLRRVIFLDNDTGACAFGPPWQGPGDTLRLRDSLRVAIARLPLPAEPGRRQALFHQCGAWLLIWADCVGGSRVSISYLYSLQEGELLQGKVLADLDQYANPWEDILRWTAAMQHGQAGRYAESVAELRRLNDPEGPFYLNAMLKRGQAHLMLGQWEEARLCYDEAIAAEPLNPSAFNERGSAQVRRGDYLRAEEDFRAAVRLEPGFAEAWRNLALLHLSAERHEAALEGTRAYRQLRPAQGEAYGLAAAAFAGLQLRDSLVANAAEARRKGFDLDGQLRHLPQWQAVMADPALLASIREASGK